MTIPTYALIGGMLLGVSALLLLLFSGKIAGISGIAGGLLRWQASDRLWRVLFLVGMIGGGWAGVKYLGGVIPSSYDITPWQLAVAGLLVGVGTAIGNGCTSGHGICGMGRFSTRSVVATVVFMAVAIITVFVRLHLLG